MDRLPDRLAGMGRRGFLQAAVAAVGGGLGVAKAGVVRRFCAGAAVVDISPVRFPAIVSGGFLQKKADRLNDPLYARCLVLDDGATRLAIVVVDTLMMPRELIDDAKRRIREATGIPADRVLVSATHTHSAPSVMGALGTGVDPDYAPRLPGWIAQSVVEAVRRFVPARVGWTVTMAAEHTHCRRWIYRPDRMLADAFGERTVRANMHPGYQNADCVGPAGAVDRALSMLAVQTAEGRPLAVLANYSMHYAGSPPVSADYCGAFCRRMGELAADPRSSAQPVVMMSQGTSGDLHWMDYGRPAQKVFYAGYGNELARLAIEAYRTIEYREWAELAMAETRRTFRRRTPDEKRLRWAREVVAAMKDPAVPANRTEVYAREQIYLHEEPQREIVLQAVRVGELGITAIPNEVFGLTGLKLKAQSPLTPTFNIELANGGDGYIPPPEQHGLGGYTTWPARTAGLDVEAEPRIVKAVLELLEKVSGKPRRKAVLAAGAYAAAVLESKPAALWRMGEMAGREACDTSGNGNTARYEGGHALYLDGPVGSGFGAGGEIARAVHLAGGRIVADVKNVGAAYTLEGWFWNGLPSDARAVTGWLLAAETKEGAAEGLGIGGTAGDAGRLFVSGGKSGERMAGGREIRLKSWNHVVLVREGRKVAVYLNGERRPEIAAELSLSAGSGPVRIIVGGRGDGEAGLEGKVSEVALYSRALAAEEIARHYAVGGVRG